LPYQRRSALNNNTTGEPETDGPRRVGFIGLGNMGSAMALRLIEAGCQVTVWARTAGKVDALVERGAVRGEDPEDSIGTGVVFSMLSNDDAVRQVFTPARLNAAPEGFIHVNHATISPRTALEIASIARENGSRYVSAPVLGRPKAVLAGNVAILASGEPEGRTAVTPLLEAIGRRVWDFGPSPASALAVKVSVNYLIIHALQALAESVTMLERQGLDTEQFIEVINDSVFPGPVYSGYGHAIATSNYTPPGFTARLGLKDLGLALGLAEDLTVSLPTGAVLQEIFEEAVENVGQDLDWACIAEVTRRRAGHDRHQP
jgi:3-hydroxyisobutyrate dehydrogenase-like beta-hydroxyacid dehydrogenase